MSSVFGLDCASPPPTQSILFSTPLFPFGTFIRHFFFNPNISSNKNEQFLYAKFFFLTYTWYVIWRIPNELSRMLNNAFGVNYSILLLIHIIFILELFRKHGYECTLFLTLIIYIIYQLAILVTSYMAHSTLADEIPELKELPLSKNEPGINHCRRLAICKQTPVFDNYSFQKGKYNKCLHCAKRNKGIIFDDSSENCSASKRNIDAEKCYTCNADHIPNTLPCKFSDEQCKQVTNVLKFIDPVGSKYGDSASICKKSNTSLCWLVCAENLNTCTSYMGWNQGPNTMRFTSTSDSNANGHGYPTEEICKQENPGRVCTRITKCRENNIDIAKCVCRQYNDVAQMRDPCILLRKSCDENSLAYTEAVLKVKQSNIDTSKIITASDASKFFNQIDNIVKTVG